MGFSNFKLNKQLLTAIAEAGYNLPTAIQIKAIPLIQSGHDVIGIAQTGTGKTAAYLLPLLKKLNYAQGKSPRALILAPTRELVIQIEENARTLSAYTDLRMAGIFGGKGIRQQIDLVKTGIDLLIATPGRFWDVYKSGELITKELKTMVLDEADRMMDMGFAPQLRRIFEVVPAKRQNLLFSATMPEKVNAFCNEFLVFPFKAEVTPESTPAENVVQKKLSVPNFKTKLNLLLNLLENENYSRLLIFVKTKQSANNIYKFLLRKKIGEVKVIHSNKDQNFRLNAINQFSNGELRVLVATDVAARGIDVAEISHVINFDVPVQYEDYVHRIGRTGRASAKGDAITFVSPADEYHIRKIEKLIKAKIPLLNLPSDIKVEMTPFEEQQVMNREIDKQKKSEDPTFRGAFHLKLKRKRK